MNGDALDEARDVLRRLSDPTNATIADGKGVGTITDDDPPAVSIDDVTVTEGDTGAATPPSPSRSTRQRPQVTVNYATANGTATAPADYTRRGGRSPSRPARPPRPSPSTVNGDTLDEANETFNVNLSIPTNATIPTARASARSPTTTRRPPSRSTTSQSPRATAARQATFNVTLAASGRRSPSTRHGQRHRDPPADYTVASGTLTFQPGETTKTVTVSVKGDTLDEANETFIAQPVDP